MPGLRAPTLDNGVLPAVQEHARAGADVADLRAAGGRDHARSLQAGHAHGHDVVRLLCRHGTAQQVWVWSEGAGQAWGRDQAGKRATFGACGVPPRRFSACITCLCHAPPFCRQSQLLYTGVLKNVRTMMTRTGTHTNAGGRLTVSQELLVHEDAGIRVKHLRQSRSPTKLVSTGPATATSIPPPRAAGRVHRADGHTTPYARRARKPSPARLAFMRLDRCPSTPGSTTSGRKSVPIQPAQATPCDGKGTSARLAHTLAGGKAIHRHHGQRMHPSIHPRAFAEPPPPSTRLSTHLVASPHRCADCGLRPLAGRWPAAARPITSRGATCCRLQLLVCVCEGGRGKEALQARLGNQGWRLGCSLCRVVCATCYWFGDGSGTGGAASPERGSGCGRVFVREDVRVRGERERELYIW